MKLSVCSPFLKSAAVVGVCVLQIAYPITLQSAGADHNIRARLLGADARSDVTDGYLQVYSATDEFDDGGTKYYSHSSYVVYANDGKVFKTVQNHISRNDEVPDRVPLPAGMYTVEARSETRGYIRLPVVVRRGHLTILDLENEQSPMFGRFLVKVG